VQLGRLEAEERAKRRGEKSTVKRKNRQIDRQNRQTNRGTYPLTLAFRGREKLIP
jgi:hypothetical protein